jgi:succinyl-diaminopimelate desuccinylase
VSSSGRDLLQLTAELVDIASVSHDEASAAEFVAGALGDLAHLQTVRIGDNVISRTSLGRRHRLLVAGHLDTVPPNGNEHAVLCGDRCSGIGACDMKGGLAVMLELARGLREPAVDVTFVFYAREEVAQRFSGLLEIEATEASLLAADAAILCEPTSAAVEAGCQGVLRVEVHLKGERAHLARSWTGVNAIHRLGPLLRRIDDFEERKPILQDCEYHESLQAVRVNGGVANNVVPDEVCLLLSLRYAPDRTKDEAFEVLCDYLAPTMDVARGDSVVIEESALAAAPNLDHPLLAALVAASSEPPRAKLGWSDVSFFAGRGVPAANFGPGDPLMAHNAGEWVAKDELEAVYAGLLRLASCAL